MASSARIDELRKKFDENPRRYFAPLANEYRKSGDLEQAIFICQEYLPQQPGHMSGHIVYGQALFELSRFDEARAVFETALSLDPENLIALRHLGDISRQAGDLRGARGWYQRVLEADPRNEEIAQIMMTLLATPDDSMPAVSPMPTSDGTTTVPADSISVPTPMSSLVIERTMESAGLESAPELSALREVARPAEPAAPPPPSSTWGEAPPAHHHELLDLDDFSVGGVPLSSLGAPPPEIDPVPPPSAASEQESASDAEGVEFETASIAESAALTDSPPESSSDAAVDLAQQESQFEADPFAITATPESSRAQVDDSPIELASDLGLGLRPDGMTSTTFSEMQGERIADLESFGETLKGAEAADVARASHLEIDTFFADLSRDTGALGDPGADLDRSSHERVETRTPTPQFVEAVPGFSLDPVESFDIPAPVEEATLPAFEASESADEPPPIPPFETALSLDEPLSTPAFEASLPLDEPLSIPAFEASLPVDEPPIPAFEISDAVDEPPAIPAFEMPSVEAAPIAFESEHLDSIPAAASAAPQSVPAWTPPEPQPAAPSEEFVTETMAELYLEQGHPEAAVDIYRRLIAQRPDDEQLSARLRAVEANLNGESASPTDDEPAIGVASSIRLTIREFLAGLLRFAPSATPSAVEATSAEASLESSASPMPTAQVPTPMYDFEAIEPLHAPTPPYDLDAIDARSILTPIYGLPEVEAAPPVANELPNVDEPRDPADEFAGEDALADSLDDMELMPPVPAYFTPVYTTPIQSTPVRPTPVRATPASPLTPTQAPAVKPTLVRATPGSSETVSGSIDALFSGATASSADADAAAALSQAFAPDAAEPPALPGVPAHTASNELSLDHVFKSTPPRPKEAENDSFSFDQFFADDLSEGSPKAGAEPTASPGQNAPGGDAGDDIAQFNNWLNSLKKT